MGNDQYHNALLIEPDQFEVVKKTSSYCILKGADGQDYIKFIYTTSPKENSSFIELRNSRKSSIFNPRYLKFRYQQQINTDTLTMLPKIVAFGEQTNNQKIISCANSASNFVIFQHPLKTLRQEVDSRITSGSFFSQIQLLTLMKSVVLGLSQVYQHTQSLNQELTQKKQFILTDENIYVSNQGKCIVSDILSNPNEIQSISRQQMTLKKQSRSTSLTNLHSLSSIYGKQKKKQLKNDGKIIFFQQNLSNLASIMQGILFKFQCFALPLNKNTSVESQSLSTALESCRLKNQNFHCQAELQNLLKQLKKIRLNFGFNQKALLQNIENLLTKITLFTNSKHNEQSTTFITKKTNKSQQSFINAFSANQSKIDSINNEIIQRKPLFQVSMSNLNSQKNQMKSLENKNHGRIRLSIKRESIFEKQKDQGLTNLQQFSNPLKKIERKKSHPKFLCSKKNDSKGKQNIQLRGVLTSKLANINEKQNLKSNLCQNLGQPFAQIKEDGSKTELIKKKICLKKPSQAHESLKNNQINYEQSIHLNPMSRKKTIGFHKCLTQSQKKQMKVDANSSASIELPNPKTVEKGQIDLQLIENLSSIISNHNNTLSSYGIPVTDEFKTDNSLIQEEGCLPFSEITDQFLKMPYERSQNGKNSNEGNFAKKQSNINSTCVKLSSYPSLQLVQSIIERPEDKIPQFLKQFKLPEKNLLALNNIILKQKDMIMQESYQQSDFNSIRQSYPNILAFQEQLTEITKKRSSKFKIETVQLMECQQ